MAKRARTPTSRRRPKGDKRARTRAKLIEAAAEIIREKGYGGTALEDVARRAGMTRGAIYGNFKNREELFLAVVQTRWKPIAPPFRPGATFKQQLRILGESVVASMPARRATALGALSFQLYALQHEEMRKQLVALNKEIYRLSVDKLLEYVPADELPMPAPQLVRVLHALIEGLTLLRFLTPELTTDDVIIAAFDAFA
jgi:AcrR family transcriptional regulator